MLPLTLIARGDIVAGGDPFDCSTPFPPPKMGLGSIGTYEVVKACRILDFSVAGKRLAVDVANFGYKWYHTGADVQSDAGINNLRRRVFGFMALARQRGVEGVTFVFDGEPLALKMEVTHKKRREALKRGKKRAEDKRSSAETRLAEASNRQQGGQLAGVAAMGFLSALIVGPCVAPPLMAALQDQAPDKAVSSTADHGLAPQWVEACAFAWLARQCLLGQPGNCPAVTGASRSVILGAVYPA